MDRKWYEKTTEEKLKKLTVESLVQFSNDLGSMPAGTRYRILRKMNGLSLESIEACKCCGFKFRVSKVPPSEIRVVGGP